LCGVRPDPVTHAFILATAMITSVVFTISMMNVLALILYHFVG
jgi:hypothetical protein